MASKVELIKDKGKSRTAGLVLAFIVLVVMALANFPYQYVETEGHWVGSFENDDNEFRRYQVLPRMAGWPVGYWVRYEDEDRYWSTLGLIANLGIALCLSLIVYGYIQLRNRYANAAHDRRRSLAIFDVGIALAILVIPVIVIASEYRIAIQHQRLVKQLNRHGNCYLSCWLPERLADQLPIGLIQSLMRLRQVNVVAADQQLIESVADLPTLVSLRCYSGNFDASTIAPLRDNVHFSGFQLSRRSLSESDLDAISRLRWLVQLNLTRTNLNSKMLRCFDQLEHLRLVDLSGTPLVLSELGVPRWSATVEDLRLSRPADGAEGSLTIDGWPRLKRLAVSRLSVTLNASNLKLRLSNLPDFEFLHIDRVQKHHLILHNLPRLVTINDAITDLQQLLGNDDLLPGLTWVSNLDLDGVASLTRMDCFARDLESISIRDTPSLRSFALGSYLVSSIGYTVQQPADARRCQTWIDTLGASDRPSTIDFTALPLSQADLSPLVNNSRIRHLRLGNSGVSFQQIEQLKGMDQLESLDLSDCRLEDDQLGSLLQQFPNLKELAFDGAGLTRFDPSGTTQLKTINTTTLENVEDLRIVDLPLLNGHIRMSCTPLRMEIRNAQSLRGLAIQSPWPTEATVSGLRDLEWFVGGGEAIDDALMDVVLQCKKLDQLTLAYTSITRKKLMEIGQLHELSVLVLPGADVDDQVTANWSRLKSLWELNLDDTSVSVGTIAWLSRIDSLRRLSLNRVVLNDAASDALAELRQVSEMHLVGTSLETRKLKPLLQGEHLESLNLSGWKVDAEFVDAIEGSFSLRHLILHDCDIDVESLERLLASNQSLYVDLGIMPDFVSDAVASELQQRALEVRRSFSTGWREVLRMGNGRQIRFRVQRKRAPNNGYQVSSSIPSSSIPSSSGTIDLQMFRPRPIDNPTIE